MCLSLTLKRNFSPLPPTSSQHKQCHSLLGQCCPDPRAPFTAPFWVKPLPHLPPFCFLDLTKIISCPAEILSIILPLGVYFASDRNMASSPFLQASSLISQEPASTKSCRQTWEVLAWRTDCVYKPTTSAPKPWPPLCSEMYCFF